MTDKKIRGNFPASEGMAQVNTIADLKLLKETDIDSVQLLNHTLFNDFGGGLFLYDSTSTLLDDGGTVIIPTYAGFGGIGRWVRQLPIKNEVTPYMFGMGTTPTHTTIAIQAALNWQNTSIYGSFTVRIPDAPNGAVTKYSVTGTGPRILEIQNGTRLIGSSLEGTIIDVAVGSTSPVLLEDAGDAEKIEIYNLTLMGNNNTNITSILRLGHRTLQFGTYGSLDNVMCRDAPNAIGFDLNTNIAACGKLYTQNTKDGLISDPAGSGLHIETFTPIAFTGIGIQLALADSVNFYEGEAPLLNTTIPIVFERGGSISNVIISIQAGQTIESMVQINNAFVSDFVLTDITVLLTGTGFYGNSVVPGDTGTATSGTVITLVDTSKDWALDQWKNGVVFITGGTGIGQRAVIDSNTSDSISISGTFALAPDATSVYALDYFIKKTLGGGLPMSKSITINDLATNKATIDNLKTGAITIGRSNDSTPIIGIYRKVVSLDFGIINANAVGVPLNVTVDKAQPNMPVILGVSNGLQSGGIIYTATVSAANTVTIYPKNITIAAINPPAGTFVITVFDYV